MKKWGFFIVILLCLGFAFINNALSFQDKAESQPYDQNHKDFIL